MEDKRFYSEDNKVYTQEEFIEAFKDVDAIKKFKELPIVIIGYDSTVETMKHMRRVNELLLMLTKKILDRASEHDETKLSTQEKELFDKYTPLLKDCTYGSDEYKGFLAGLGEALEHHYQHNRHHPEYHKQGIEDMTLIDILEMLADWKAASERHDDGSIMKSIDESKDRFKLTKQLTNILKNTAKDYF